MSRENVEVVRRVYEAAARHDTEAVLALYAPEAVFDFSRSPFASVMSKDRYCGHEDLRRLFRERYEAWEEIRDEYDELVEADQQVISTVTSRGRGRTSGIEVEQTHHGVWTIQAGKILSVAWFGTLGEAREAAGLTE